MSFKGQLLKAGISSNGKDVTIFHDDGTFTVKGNFDLGKLATNLTLSPASDRALDVHTTCALTAGTIRSVEINQTQTGASYTAIIEALRVNVATAVMTGDWCNAIVGVISYTAPGTAGGGMAAAICAEVNLPAQSMGGGTYALFHGYLGVPTSCVLEDSQTHVVALLRLEAGGGAVGEFDDHGYPLHVVGLTAGAGHAISAQSQTLKVLIGSTERYMVLSTAENCLTLGDCTVGVDLAGTMTDGIIISGATTDGIEIQAATDSAIRITGTPAYGINMGAATTGISMAGVMTTGISLSGTYSKGIDLSSATMTQGLANVLIGIGTQAAPKSVALTDYYLPFVVNLKGTANAAAAIQCGYFKVSTDGANEMASAQLVGVATRLVVDMNLDSGYSAQCHMDISGTKTSSELIAVSAYGNIKTGARTADRVCALQAMLLGEGTPGTVVGDCIVGYFVNGGNLATTDSIIEVKNQSAATVTNAITLDLDGTCDYAFNFDGAVSDGWTSGDGAVVQADEYVKIPVKVKGVTPTLYILAAETWA